PEPGLSSTDDNGQPIPLPSYRDNSGNGASLMRNEDDDDEDLDAAFIQAAYKVPQKSGETAGRARLGSSPTAASTGIKGSKAAAKKARRSKSRSRDDQELKVRYPTADGS